MFKENNREEIKIAWDNFINNESMVSSPLRKEILKSWVRSRNHGVNWQYVKRNLLSKDELNKRIRDRKTLVEIASRVMETIYSTVKNSGFLVVLTDEEGYVLKIIGDADADTKAKAQENILIEGTNRSEKYIGTNGIGISLVEDIPIQVWADEHYYVPHRHWTCSAAPIHNLNGEIIGCLNLSGPWDRAHLHSLGMVVAGVKAIENQMTIKKAYDQVFLSNNQLNATLSFIPYGTILVNNTGHITHINNFASTMLNLNTNEVTGSNIDDVLKYDKSIINLKSIGKNIYDKEVLIETLSNSIRCSISITIVKNSKDENNGIVLTLKESKSVHKLINKMTASQADFVFNDIIGDSPSINKTKKFARIAAESNTTVLLLGESGTGKELFAQSIHNNSSRANKPFIAINCGALPRNLIESELFGYEGGAFTGAKKEGRPGKFELANGGTLFLDEIGDLPLDIQATLLRVLENRELTRIGGTENIKVDVRVITATNKNLEELIENKMYREDLYYRINVFSINIPSLKEREGDIKLLAQHFLGKHTIKLSKSIKGFNAEVLDLFLSYNWPGNIRELENIVERAINVCQGNYITMEDMPKNLIDNTLPISKKITSPNNNNYSIEISSLNLKDLEAWAIKNALIKYKGNIRKAVDELGIGRRTIYRKFEEYSIDYNSYRK